MSRFALSYSRAIIPPMEIVRGILPYVQIILSLLIITTILLQQTGTGAGGAFGGSDGSGAPATRRGLEKTLFNVTIILGVLFALSAFLALIL